MKTRRQFLKTSAQAGAAIALWPAGCANQPGAASDRLVNDMHSQLNPTRVRRIERPQSLAALQAVVKRAANEGVSISIAGGRHAMGGQQFGTDAVLTDTTAMKRVLSFDADRGLIEVEAGMEWPELIRWLVETQRGGMRQWGIIQKQTGADRLSIGGALSANVHGRGLRLRPFVADVESFVLVDANGRLRECNRRENAELFRLAIGGYGLFGVIASVKLRLAPRRKVQRIVKVIEVEELLPSFEQRIAEGFLFGDFQYAIDNPSDGFLRKGVFSCYRPVDDNAPVPEGQKELSGDDWRRLLHLAHTDKARVYDAYADYYLSTSGQTYWSDTHQLSVYIDNYHQWLDARLGATARATEMITEIYVPRPALTSFLDEVRREFRQNNTDIIYGTIRLIERDDESFLAWARQPYACIIFNLHVMHTPQGIDHASQQFRFLIDRAIAHRGSYYLTYHRFATRPQVLACYPQFTEFLRLKQQFDPAGRFQSDWYRHYRQMFAGKE